MPRNASGIYTLPDSNPVATGEIITSDWANETMTDIEDALSASLPRDGSAPMTGKLSLIDGLPTSPALRFTKDPQTGMYRTPDGKIGFAIKGITSFEITADGATIPKGKMLTIVDGPVEPTDAVNKAYIDSLRGASILKTWVFVATKGQTVFTGVDSLGSTLDYISTASIVLLNGVTLQPADYTFVDSKTVKLIEGVVYDEDIVMVIEISGATGPQGPQGPAGDSVTSMGDLTDVDLSRLDDGQVLVYNAGLKQWIPGNAPQGETPGGGTGTGTDDAVGSYDYTATEGQVQFSGLSNSGWVLGYKPNSVIVSLNGTVIHPGADYAATDGVSIVLTEPAQAGDAVLVLVVAGSDGADGADGAQGEQGVPGYGARYAGRINNYTELEALTPTARPGQFYITNDTGEGYFALESSNTPGTVSAWEFMGRLVGQDGAVGPTGPQGAPGVTGAQGPTGPQGPQGATGAKGDTGNTGPTGPTGPQGAQGIPGLGINYIGRVPTVADLPPTATHGDTYIIEQTGEAWVWEDRTSAFENAGKIVGPEGPQGSPGVDGAAGPQGPAGVQGPTGAQGPAGETGPAGPAGADGAAGPQGEQGIQGEVGPMGPAGPKGDKGDKGDIGEMGSQGPAGADGATGPVGPQGPEGPAGVQGPQGETGATGPAGADGAQGEQGIPGLGITFKGRVATVGDLPATAVQGDMYIVDATGDAWVWSDAAAAFENAGPIVGPQGAQGPTGPQGETGATGPAGADGVQGPAGPVAVSADANNISKLGTDGLLYTPASSYELPIASATRLGGVKVGTGMTVTADGTISTVASTNYVSKNGDVMNGALRYSDIGGVSSFNGSDVYTYYGGGYYRIHLPGGKSGIIIEIATAKVTFAAAPKCASAPVDGTDLANKTYVDSAVSSSTAYLKTTGGTMTGAITLPTTVQSLTWGTSTYNIFGASGGVAIRYGNANIVNFTATGASFTQKITTPGSGIGVEFGSSGGYLSKVGTGIGAYIGGQLRWTFSATEHMSTIPIASSAEATAANHLVPKSYVDAKPTIISMPTGATPPDAASYPNNTLLVEYA